MSKLLAAAAAGLFAVAIFAGTAEAQTQQPHGVWRNPGNSVHVRIQPCGREMCGTVVWASARAQEKARAAGTSNLIGAQLFRQFRAQGGDRWGGRVFVPDRARTVAGTMRVTGRSAIVSGCLMGGLVCRSQTWTRVS